MNNLQAHSSTFQDRGIRLILALIAISTLSPVPVRADEQAATESIVVAENTTLPGAIEIEGDTLQLRMDRQMRAIGNAVIRKEGQQVTGDDIRYDIQNDELQVDGNAVITAGQTKITGPMLRMRMSENIGEMRDVNIEFKSSPPPPSNQDSSALLNDEAILLSDPKRYLEDDQSYSSQGNNASFENIRATAKQVLFEGQNIKRLKKASYTSCAADVDDWYIKTNNLELNDYTRTGEATNAFVEFKGVPILYTPWMSFSYNNQRKSGLLAPLWGTTSRSGFELLTPYYINIRPDMDATIATRFLSKRGTQLQGEFRYLGEDYSGINNFEYLDNDSMTGQTRFYAKLSHAQRFSEHWSGGYNLEKVSDDKYFSEMATRIQVTSRVNLQQTAFVDYQDDHWTFNGSVQRYQNLDNKSFVYQRLPQLTVNYDNSWNGITTQTVAQYVYFDSLQEMGTVPTGSRLNFYPSLSYPMKNSYGFVTPKFGVNTTQYSLNNNVPNGYSEEYNQLSRTLPIFSLDSGLYFDRESSLFGTNYTHTLEPRAYYVYIPYRDQSKIPIFDTALATLNQDSIFTENQFIGGDRVNNANQTTLAITSRLIDAETGIERISATLGQRFYFEDQKVSLPSTSASTRKSSDILAGFTARLSSRLNLDTFWQYDPDRGNMERNNYLLRYNPEPGKSFSFGYRYTANTLEQFDTSVQWPFGAGWYGISRLNYSIRDGNAVQFLGGLEYDAGCWQARAVMQRVQTATANANYAMFFQLELGGLTSIGANPLNVIKRNIPSYMRTYDIPAIYRDQNSQ
ncbi:LPS-assembly protein LptD [Methylophilus sp.]|uniref:LPS-assembly protein LptD n=1 Tax=Methylophilus sp. TaxID=29541 RepID=UPI0011D7EDDF|nr:LPS-assembly protein LptD [Methylophilus sp.]TXI44867.1 MAG: LPS-assembly protein LptD [Methylophilus sp.]